MSEWFRDFARETGTPMAPSLDFELCLNELMANVIRYAYRAAGESEGPDPENRESPHRLRVSLERRPGLLAATLEDDGRPFDPTSVEDPSATESLADARVGGWGIPILRAFASAIRYERRDGKNVVSIEMPVSETESRTAAQ